MGLGNRKDKRRRILRSGVRSVSQYSRQIFAVSGVNGISHIALARSGGRRVLWATLFAIGIVGWFYQTTTLLDYYYRYPSVVQIHVEKPQIMDFPAFTLCNVNRYFSLLYDPHLGNCYAFSSGGGLRPRLYVTEPDAWQDKKDLELVLNVEQDEYLDGDETPGLIVTLHEDTALPNVLEQGVHVYAEHTYSLSLEKVSVNLLSKPFKTNCTDFRTLPFRSNSHMQLSPRICTVKCLLYYQKLECGHSYVTDNVVLYAENMPYDPKQVTEGDRVCANRLSEDRKDFCRSLCSVPCHDTHYPVVVDSTPLSPHKTVVTDEDLKSYRLRRGEEKQIHLSDVRIFYQTLQHRVFNHTPEFTTELLFSYLGGISGGWLGISLLEFCAFVEGTLSVLMYALGLCCTPPRMKSRRKARPSRGPSVPPKGTPSACHKKCHCNSGGVLLGLPLARSGRGLQVVPYGYY